MAVVSTNGDDLQCVWVGETNHWMHTGDMFHAVATMAGLQLARSGAAGVQRDGAWGHPQAWFAGRRNGTSRTLMAA